MKLPAVYIYKKTDDGGLELKHSLRSLKNIKNWNGEVFVAGHREPWMSEEVQIIKTPPGHFIKQIDQQRRLWAIIHDKRVADDFLYFNDDFFIIDEIEIEPYYDGLLTPIEKKSSWKILKENTREYLEAQGVSEVFNYETHTPMEFNKQKLTTVLELLETEPKNRMQPRTLYGNINEIGGKQFSDNKSEGSELATGRIISTSFFTKELEELFPERSIFELKKQTVSVVMPVYNQEMLVLRALFSIPEIVDEIIICNDGSTDGSLELIKEWAKGRKNVKVLSHKKNRGVGYTLNKCYEKISTDYFVELDSDDYFHPEIEQVIDLLNGADIVFFNASLNDGSIRKMTKASYRNRCENFKFIRTKFMGSTRAREIFCNEDKYFHQDLIQKDPSVLFTDILAKHYNRPREGSLVDLRKKGLINESGLI